ncbi:hypothetical protein Kpho02_16250 [Kitasatospora phosalacinea]|uniref:Parallel beta helix pectate lyase-like protein n=1 Tax=Kitasatospora phosalacinea TaxID=2065 RepID=A0A9W6Q5U6_9ACTN|nr:hypothetical protein Kpho02_16250 [Kitasatospora phosalacinea]
MTHRPHRGAAAAGALALGSAVLALLPAQAGAATELLVNGGFESASLSPWTCTGTAATTTSAPHSGTAALTASPGSADLAPCTQGVTVQPNTGYTLTAWVKGPYVTLAASGTGVSTSTWANAPGWTQLTRTFTTGPNTTRVTVALSGWYGSPYQADDVSLTATGAAPTSPPPASASPTPSAPVSTPGQNDATLSPPPADTVRVSTAKELQAALSAAVPGRTIQLADGTYTGNFKITTAGTAAARITLTGSPNAVLTTSTGGGYGLSLAGAPYWTVRGVTVTNAQKGIVVDASDHVVLDGVTVHHTTMEGVHFRNSSSYGVLRNSTVHDTGTAHDGKGEGVYVGTANTLTDHSDHVQILNNTIGPNIGGENVDLKEGTTGGLVSGNRFDGNGLTNVNYDDSWVDVKGNGYVIENNTGVHTLNDGYQTHTQQPGWGCGTVFRGNTSDLTGATGTAPAKYAIDVTNYDATACPVTVTADNTATGPAALTNPGVPVG